MFKSGKSKAEAQFAKIQKKSDQALNNIKNEKIKRAEHGASLKALRLAKAVSDQKVAKASK